MSVHFHEMPGFKGKRKRGLTLTLYKKPFRYRVPVSPPRKRTKTGSSTPNLKSPLIGTPSLLKKSVSISKYLYPFKRVSTSIRRNLFYFIMILLSIYIYNWIGNKFLQLTSPSPYKYINNINKTNQMTVNVQAISIIISKLSKIMSN